MKTRWKIVLTVLAAATYFLLTQQFGSPAVLSTPCRTVDYSTKKLYKFYAGVNNAYFDDKLSKDPVINLDEKDPQYEATTDVRGDGRFVIQFNTYYVVSERYAYITLLHEMCHVYTIDENDFSTRNHGPRWRACMVNLEIQGAWRHQLIDYYEDKQK